MDTAPPEDDQKKYRLPLLKTGVSLSAPKTVLFSLAFAIVGGIVLLTTLAASPKPTNSGGTQTYKPMTYTQYVNATGVGGGFTGCMQNDMELRGSAQGSLNPGESFEITPFPTCWTEGFATFSMRATWDQSDIKLSTITPSDAEAAMDHPNQLINAVSYGNTARLCMYMRTPTDRIPTYAKFKLTNTGSQTAYNVKFDLVDAGNAWVQFMITNCLRSDANNDGWNDGFEQMLLQFGGRSSDYLSSTDQKLYPPDQNGDGVVNQSDIDVVNGHVGEGSSCPVWAWRCSPGCPVGIYLKSDLNADCKVDQKDVDTVQKLIGLPVPAPTDIISPHTFPTLPTTLAKGKVVDLSAFAFDNAGIAYVEFYINGKLYGTDSDGGEAFYYANLSNPGISGLWSVPGYKTRSNFTVTVKAVDYSGNSTTASQEIKVL